MIIVSIVFGAVSTFVPLYTIQYEFANAGIFLTIQAIAVVLARMYLRKYIPSDGRWHPLYMVSVLLLLAIASLIVAIGPHVHVVIFYLSAIFIGVTQALLYPTLTSYLSFVLPKSGRNMLLGLFIACADLGVSLGGSIMGPVSDLVGLSWMYVICGILVMCMMLMSIMKKGNVI